MTEILIRSAQKTDLEPLYQHLLALMRHEGIENRFLLTLKRFETELFGPRADWHCLVAADDGDKPIGFCLYSFCNINRAFNLTPVIHIDDFYVSPEYRKQGVGRKLIAELQNIAKKNKISRLNVWCMKENKEGQQFYQKLGAEKLDFLDVFKLRCE